MTPRFMLNQHKKIDPKSIMKKVFLLLMPLLCLSQHRANAQVVADSADIADYNDLESFVFSGTELDEDGIMSSQGSAALSTFNDDMFLSKTNFRFGHAFFNVRGYDSMYSGTYLNGAKMNDVELGRFRYSALFGGLSDVTRNQQGITSYEQNTLGYMDLGGGSNVNVRASQFAAGNKAVVSLTNRNYIGRLAYTYATGIKNGWAFAATANVRYGEEGNIKGTYMRAASLFLGVERFFNDQHSLSLSLIAAPTDQATASWTTEEAYWLANSHYYNPFWGYQNGKKRSSRVRKTVEPTAILTWDYKIDDQSKLTTTTTLRYAKYGQTYLNRGNNAADPRPDYYNYMPSAMFAVYEKVPNEWELYKWQQQYDYWTSSERNRQIDWDKLYAINHAANGESVYWLEESHDDQLQWNIATAFNHNFNSKNSLNAGLNYSYTHGMHYKTMSDLLGSQYHTDIDRFAVSDFGLYSDEAQNDLDNPNRIIRKGDKFGYNYNINVNKAQAWASYSLTASNFSAVFSGDINGTTIERVGLMRNGRSPEHSKGSSGTAKFLSGGGKIQLGYNFNAHHRVFVSGGYEWRPPIARNAFIGAQMRNDFVKDLANEKVMHGEIEYRFNWGNFYGQLNGFYTKFQNQIEQAQFFDDGEQRFTYLTMNGIDKEHYGAELALEYRFTSNFSMDFVGALTEAKYVNDASATRTYDDANDFKIYDDTHDMPLIVVTNGMRVGATPLTALSVGAKYNINGYFFEVKANYYDRIYSYFSPSRRLSTNRDLASYTPTIGEDGVPYYNVTKAELEENGGLLFDQNGKLVDTYSPKQEKFDGAFMLDASIGKFIRLKQGRTMSINLNLTNITNNTNMRMRGREENRDNTNAQGNRKAYDFRRNSKYVYAYPFNLFLNVNYKF